MEPCDLLVVGAGPTGCVIAERAAAVLGWRVIIIDKRRHLAGNCFDEHDDAGYFVQRYGPHYFRTWDDDVVRYLSRFTDWIDGNYVVQSLVRGRLYPFPINLVTLERYFGRQFTPESAREHLDHLRDRIEVPRNSEEHVVSRVGWELYRDFYLEYTKKQWNRHPRDLDTEVCGRIPVRFNRDCRYTDAPFQKMPAAGYTRMFARMIDHPLITVLLGVDWRDVRDHARPTHATVYTGPLDEYFDGSLGSLAWRSLEFEFRHFDDDLIQPCVQINYPDARNYTRSVEFKHVTGQHHPGTVVMYEYPRDHGDPYYPVPSPANRRLYRMYKELAERETRERNVHFCGRLAEYRYINTDTAIRNALDLFDRIGHEYRHD